jgi:hypothetical protein
MAETVTSEVDAKPSPVRLGLLRGTFGNHGNQNIVVWQLKPYFCTNKSHVGPMFENSNNGRFCNNGNHGM